jgi:hypothetical protein
MVVISDSSTSAADFPGDDNCQTQVYSFPDERIIVMPSKAVVPDTPRLDMRSVHMAVFVCLN